CQSVATTRDRDAGQRLADMLVLREDVPAVRRVAAEALGRIGDPQAVTWLLRTLDRGPGRPLDRAEEHAVIYALIEIGDPRGTAEGLTYVEPAIRRGALIALQQMDARLEPQAVISLLESDDDSAAAAALEVFALHSEWSEHAARLLNQWLTSANLSQRQRGQARRLATAFLAQPPVASLVGELLAAETTSLDARRALLGSLADAKSIPLHDTWAAGLHKLLATDDPLLLDEVLAAVAAIKTDRFSGTLQQLAADTARPPLVRVAALEAMGHGSSELSGEAFQLLLELLASRAVPGQAGRAAALLGNSSLNSSQLQQLAPRLAQAGPLELRSLIKPYAGHQDPGTGREFLAAVERSPGMYGLSAEELSAVVQRFPPDLLPRAEPLLEKLRAKDQQRQQRLAELESYLERGDAQRGRALFALESTKCNTCHRVGEEGGKIGPDLTTIGRIRGSRDLLEAIVFPSASLAREYEAFNVITSSGKVLSGLVIGQTSEAVHLQPQAGPPVVLSRDEIEEIAASPVSLMPDGLDRTLSPDQVADLIAYLRSLR
ncbi:MAG: c-type cytochrome, partial [Pirellulaceae bacterium]|nr:c-type cytochrome [Pirellulaceae bacterium]